MPSQTISHIEFDERSVAWIAGANTKVIEVAMDMIAHGWSAEEIHRHHPYLSLAQIHAALAHYYDHKDEFDDAINRSQATADSLRARSLKNSPIRQKLREKGKLPLGEE